MERKKNPYKRRKGSRKQKEELFNLNCFKNELLKEYNTPLSKTENSN